MNSKTESELQFTGKMNHIRGEARPHFIGPVERPKEQEAHVHIFKKYCVGLPNR
jgi:hypothetical protein